MPRIIRKIGIGLALSALFFGCIATSHAAVIGGFQGGTGISTTTAGNVGNCLQVSSSSPWLTWTIASCGASGSVSTSSAITTNYFPYWATASGGLAGTSTLYSSSSGNIGIGTTNPTQKLDLTGNEIITTAASHDSDVYQLTNGGSNYGGAAAPQLVLSDNAGSYATLLTKNGDGLGNNSAVWGFANKNSAGNFILGNEIYTAMVGSTAGNETQDMIFAAQSSGTVAAERMRLTGAGNLYVGTTSVAAKLLLGVDGERPIQIIQADSASGYGATIDFKNNGTGGRSYSAGVSSNQNGSISGGKFYIMDDTSSTYPFVLNSSGYIGVGTSSPLNRLSVAGTEDVQILTVGTTTSNGILLVATSGPAFFVGNSGVVGIGTAAPYSSLQISSLPPQTSTSSLLLLGPNFITGGNVSGTLLGANLSSLYNGDFINFEVGSSTKFSISSLGVTSSTELRTSSGTVTNITFTNSSGTNSTLSGYLQITGALTDSQNNKYSTSTGGVVAGSQTQVQYNDGGTFAATSTFTFTSSTQRLWLNAVTSSLFIGTNANFATTTTPTGGASSTSFSYTGATSSWTIPAGVTSITVNVLGAGTTAQNGSTVSGGSATGTFSVTPGQVYYLAVGGENNQVTGGWPGGGNSANWAATNRAAGGGMTWFGTSGNNATGTTWQSTVLLVAGGAGGYGGQTGGSGGGLTGTAGTGSGSCGNSGGGTQSAGGAGGSGTPAGGNGSAGQGGAGANDSSETGGGGGGGYFGGGGGGAITGTCQAGGGGGSAFASSTLSSTSTASGINNATGTILISYTLTNTSLLSTSSAALYVGGHVFTGNQNLATSSVSSCGTSPTIAGNDTSGQVYVGSGVVTSCTINFGTAFTNTPDCVISPWSTTISAGINSESTSSFTVGFSASLASGHFNYMCLDSSE